MQVRLLTIGLMGLLSFSTWASSFSADGFLKKFKLVKNARQEVVAIRLKAASTTFNLKPFLNMLREDILAEQRRVKNLGFVDYEMEVDQKLLEMGLDPYAKDASQEVQALKESLLQIPHIPVEESFLALERSGLMRDFESRIKEALLQLDLSIVAHLDDPRFFYRRNVIYRVVTWALDQAKKRLSHIPVLNLASFVIVKVHDLLHEQRMFHHNMLLHYLELAPAGALGMGADEVDRAVSSIYEYRINATSYQESNRAAQDWTRYGWSKFYATVRAGNNRVRQLMTPMNGQGRFQQVQRISFGFAEFRESGERRIYHLMHNQHLFSSQPALAFDYGRPNKVRRDRALINLGQVALGFIPGIPNFLKNLTDTFLNSLHKEQRLMEGALVAYFDLQGNSLMIENLYKQNLNPYILR
jgi:hypothetical protein